MFEYYSKKTYLPPLVPFFYPILHNENCGHHLAYPKRTEVIFVSNMIPKIHVKCRVFVKDSLVLTNIVILKNQRHEDDSNDVVHFWMIDMYGMRSRMAM